MAVRICESFRLRSGRVPCGRPRCGSVLRRSGLVGGVLVQRERLEVSGADGSHGTPWGTNIGARFLGNQTWNGGTSTQSGMDWSLGAYAGGNAVSDTILWPASYGNVQSASNAAPALGTVIIKSSPIRTVPSAFI